MSKAYRPLHVVVLAAGAGKRMHSALPKVLQPLGGKPMLAHVLELARTLHPERIHVVYGHGGDQVRAAFADQNLVWVEQSQQLGTGHAVGMAMPGIADGAEVLVLYGDVPLLTAATLSDLLRHADGHLALLADDTPHPTGYGRVALNARGLVNAVVEERDTTPDQRAITLINTGVLCAPAADLRQWLTMIDARNAQGEFYLTDIFTLAAEAGRPAHCVRCHEAGEAEGANDRWQLAQLERRLQWRQARALTLRGVSIADPARFDLRGSLRTGRDVRIDVNVVIEGDVSLGDEVRIGPFCRIKDAELGPGTVVHAHSDIDGARSGAECVIGPYARLRPGTELADGVHIGNFVETKKSRIGRGSKANHLSYLGDAEIGAAVNVGAGTITCNYDGANKHVTRIDDGAFIGSNTALVAPVTVGKNATIGAGTTLSKDAPAEQLTVARAKQITLPAYKRPTKKPQS
jgi:bifunctional UDP-N-acetylglucosamine pyrophosphorylase/glucosamine-1-phosphate N-acetyltransferase